MADKSADEITSNKSTNQFSLGEGSDQSSSVPKKVDRIQKKPGTRRFSVESVNLNQTTITICNKNNDDVFLPNVSSNPVVHNEEEDHFLDLLVRSQSSRMNDQRCSVDPLDVKEKISDKETIIDKSTIADLRLSLGEESATCSSRKQHDKMGKKSENRRFSLENMNLLKYSPIKSNTDDDVFISDANVTNPVTLGVRTTIHPTYAVNNSEEDHFLDLLVRFQGKRMNDQRCSLDPCKNKQ